MSLYHAYRPQTFGAIVGQEHVKRTLQNAVREGKVAHAYLFSGSRGIGKTSVARILAMAVNCAKRPATSDQRLGKEDPKAAKTKRSSLNAHRSSEPCGACAS